MDYVTKYDVKNFSTYWNLISDAKEVRKTIFLSKSTPISEIIQQILDNFGLKVCYRMAEIDDGTITRWIYLAGIFCLRKVVLVRMKFFDLKTCIQLDLSVKV